MTVGAALRSALAETYRCSWRLLVVNSGLTAAMCVVVLVVSAYPLALFVAPLVAGPVAAALVHCTVTLIREEEFRLGDALEGLRLHWRRGFVLGGLFGAGLLLGVLGISFYSSAGHRVIPLAALAAYVLAVFCLLVLVAWPLAIAAPEAGLGEALRTAWLELLRMPMRFLALGAVLLIVNGLGAVTVLPLLTLTIAYSFLAAGHVVLPRSLITEEVTP
jgi:hypothetical protein